MHSNNLNLKFKEISIPTPMKVNRNSKGEGRVELTAKMFK